VVTEGRCTGACDRAKFKLCNARGVALLGHPPLSFDVKARGTRDRIAGMPMYADMQGKVALVTGGSSGIGFATAGAFARQGAKVIIASRRKGAARTALKQLSTMGDVQWFSVDAADGKSVARLMDAIMSMHGRLDYAFNNGGSGGRMARVARMPEDAWRNTIDGYLTSVFLCMNAEITAMKKPSTSVIVNNASVDGLRGYPFPGGAAYSAAKHGVIGLTRSAALEHAAQGPRICAVCPGWINTPPVANWMKRDRDVAQAIVQQTPRRTIGTPDEVAAAVLWLCSDASSFAIGTILTLDGGYLA
jgi:NAD(P)-dependent dehydrogenase (short-subunit alcohol dehydrogenase family)